MKEQQRYETSLRDFLNVVFRRKWIVLSVVGLASFLVFFINARRPDIWISASKILVSRGEQTSLFLPTVRVLSWEEEASSHIQVILSEAVFSRAAVMFSDSVRAGGLPATWRYNPGSVRADVIGESNAYVISYVDMTPDICRLGCAVTTSAFQEYYTERKAPPQLDDFFAAELMSVREDLDDWRTRRQSFLNETQFYGTEETSRFLLGKISLLEDGVVRISGDISAQELRVNNLNVLRVKSGPELEKELAFSTLHQPLQTTVVQRIKENLQRLNLQRDELGQKFTERHPEVMAVNDQIRSMHDDLEQQVENHYRVEREALDGMKARLVGLEKELHTVRAQLNTIPDKERAVADIDNMIAKMEKKHEILVAKQSESDIALASRPSWDVSVLSGASPPRNTKRNDYVRLLLGPLLAFVVGLGISFFLESTDHSIKNSAEAEEFLGVPVLATVTEFEDRKSA